MINLVRTTDVSSALRVPRSKENFYVRVLFTDLGGKVITTQPTRHYDVREHQVNFARGLELGNGMMSVHGENGAVAILFQCTFGKCGKVYLIFYDKDCFRATGCGASTDSALFSSGRFTF